MDGFDAPVHEDMPLRRRRLLAGIGGASLVGLAGVLRNPTAAGAAPAWSNFSPALKLKDVDTAGFPDIAGVTTTAQWREDTTNGLVYIQFLCAFTSAYTTPVLNTLWGFKDITTYGLPAPALGVNNVIGGGVGSHPSLTYLPAGGHTVMIAGFRHDTTLGVLNQIVFAHGRVATGVTLSYLNRNSPYDWTRSAASAAVDATVKGTIFYRRA